MKAKSFMVKCVCAMLMLMVATSCHRFCGEEELEANRTVLVYMAAENSLSYGAFHEQDLTEIMQAVGEGALPRNSRLLVYVDDTELPRILSVENQKGKAVSEVVHSYTDEHNSGDTENLRQVMEWVCENSPSKSYGLVVWSHGDAWLPAKAPVQRSICIDNERNNYSNNGTKMDIDEFAAVLSGFPRLEFIMFDACFMQAVEVAYELRHTARYIIASPAEIPNPGAPYECLVAPMFSVPFNPEKVVERYYRMYNDSVMALYEGSKDRYGVSLSAIDCDRLEELAGITSEMLVKYVPKGLGMDLRGVQRYYPLSSKTRPEFHDMNGFMSRLITNESDYSRWKSAFDKAVPCAMSTEWWYSNDARMQYVDLALYGGVSCYVPQSSAVYTSLNEKFRKTSWYEVSGWAEVEW